MKKTYWFSYSFNGENNGVCVVEANTVEEAKQKVEELKLAPESDDIMIIEIEDFNNDPYIKLNTYYSREDMFNFGYKSSLSYL